MKMIMVICSEARQKDVRELIDKHDIHAYTELTNVLGAGETGVHLNTHTWPGKSALIFSVIEDIQVEELTIALKEFQKTLYEGEGIRVFSLPAETVI